MYYISHHGIKGQRWGVRRYQNNDGSYTNAGKARYAKAFASATGDAIRSTTPGRGYNNSNGFGRAKNPNQKLVNHLKSNPRDELRNELNPVKRGGVKSMTSSNSTPTRAERKQAKRAEKGQKAFERGNRVEDIQSQKQRIHSGFNKATPVLAAVNAGLGYAAGNRYNGVTSATVSAAVSALSTTIEMKTVDFVIGKVEDTRINNLRAYYQREGKYGQSEPKKNYA